MKVLKMIAYQADGSLFNTNKTYADIPEFERDHNPWWYLHGDLENYVGYDKAVTTNCYSGGFSKNTINWSDMEGNKVISVFDNTTIPVIHINGIVQVRIEGICPPCIGYFWTIDEHEIYWNDIAYPYWKQRGLVCFEHDLESREFAFEKMKNKSIIL